MHTDARTVVSASIGQRSLTVRRQVCSIVLEMPLRALAIIGRGHGSHAADTRIQSLRDALDGATFSCRVAAPENDDEPMSGMHDRIL